MSKGERVSKLKGSTAMKKEKYSALVYESRIKCTMSTKMNIYDFFYYNNTSLQHHFKQFPQPNFPSPPAFFTKKLFFSCKGKVRNERLFFVM